MFELFVEPWLHGDWMWRGMLASLLVAVPCAFIGVFLYLRRMSMVSDALSHVALPGIVAAFLITGQIEGPWLFVGALVTGVLSTVLIELIAKSKRVKSDASIGIVFTSLFAAGIIGLSSIRGAHLDADCVLFGNVLGISDSSLITLAIVAPLAIALVLIFFRWLAMVSFDAHMAAALGIPVAFVHYGLMVGVSTTTVAGFEAVGAVLVIAFVIIPAAAAHLVADRLSHMISVAVAVAVVSTFIGMYSSIWFNCSSAGAIVVAMGTLYAVMFLFAPTHGRVSRFVAQQTPRVPSQPMSAEPQLGE